MKPAPFEYIAPTSLAEALTAVRQHGSDASLLAGGQSLVPVMNFRLAQPAMLVDLNRIPELDYVRREGNGFIRIGSMTRQRTLERHPLIAQYTPLLHEALPYIAHPQIRNRGTIGGSLAHADPAAELPVILLALNGRVQLQKSGGARWVHGRDFYTDLFTTARAEDEILTEIELPPLPPRTGVAFTEVARRHGDYALSGVAAVVTVDERAVCTAARLVYLNAGDTPISATQAAALLVGEQADEEVLTAVAHATQQEITPTTDIHATADYKRHLAKVLTVRVLQQAFTRAVNE
ncbi:MAG: xanthine dehydrogenase family protein subunit M [Chloroflexi bacterium]|nr:xanthine dehydrogenase family protein subunit M [Ardenticatenaceae bacterium]MBL1128895.1 xanthine dehydrogenase family protein subunit M [Chloroflexota bacterium]NOG34974.1 xanthine dehydrogenase family protein subunit M [Chloroflexota bacterium]GIK55210.1 MAG: carbon monoxide dehydrogenase [Chloroflexota bacterium]